MAWSRVRGVRTYGSLCNSLNSVGSAPVDHCTMYCLVSSQGVCTYVPLYNGLKLGVCTYRSLYTGLASVWMVVQRIVHCIIYIWFWVGGPQLWIIVECIAWFQVRGPHLWIIVQWSWVMASSPMNELIIVQTVWKFCVVVQQVWKHSLYLVGVRHAC